ncbi:MAG: protein kinase [Acidobacteriota bacterium]
MIGKTISHYRILEKIGEGGMGEVYLAEDTKLDRKVALKFLPPALTLNDDAKERFHREAQAAAALNHPNIVTIYEINEHEDQTYIAMEYVDGQTLKEAINSKFKIQNSKFDIEEIINITSQICEGLKCAHEAGIVHRDIKPQNIIINKEGQVKILDFGLAKLKGVSQLTKEPSTLGTVHYMSPEQAKGLEVDHRSDVWSLGVILYEMLTGELPFKGDYDQAVIYSILNEEPDTLSGISSGVQKEFEDIINKMLEKDPDQRYQTVNEVKLIINDIFNKPGSENKEQEKTEMDTKNKKRKFVVTIASVLIILTFIFIYIFVLSKPPPPENKSIAVLPFKNMSDDSQNEYFCDGITEDIITMLSKIRNLKVTSRTSVFYFKNKDKKIKDIANELGVTTILEGSVRQSGEKIRITAQLINARTDDHLWAETYDRELTDIFKIQSDVASQIAKTLRVKLLPATNRIIHQKPTENIEAYKLYLQGRFHWKKRTPEDLNIAVTFFEKAVELDPEYALGYSGLAEAYVVIAALNPESGNSSYEKAIKNCRKALLLNSELAEAHSALGGIQIQWGWEFDEAKMEFHKAIELNPNYATARQWLAEYYLIQGKFDLAHKNLDIAESLDPFAFITKVVRAQIYLSEKKYEESVKLATILLSKNPELNINHLILTYAYLGLKSYNKALEIASKSKIPALLEFIKFRVLISRGKIKEAGKLFREFKPVLKKIEITYPGAISIIYAELGNMDEAIKWFGKGVEQRDPHILFRHGIGYCEPLLNDPRIKEMLRKLGLEE